MPTPEPIHVPVLIVGGGIVGLSASLFLSHHSIPCLLVERHATTSIHPRARSVNARTMEIYRGINISNAVREAGAALSPSMGIRSGTSMKEVTDSLPRKEGKRNFPLANLFSETGPENGAWGTLDCVEPVLLEAARERGVDARFHTDCLSVSQNEAGVTAILKDRSSNNTYTVTADYLIAADGASSPIRESLGIKRTGRGDMGNLLNILFHTTPSLSDFVKNREISLCQIETPEVTGLLTSINNAERWVFHLVYSPSKGEKPSDYPQNGVKSSSNLHLGCQMLTLRSSPFCLGKFPSESQNAFVRDASS
ncbi:polyketide hydroxylase [Hyphodiscus hymeniophilus]|uniref:Polyketide hydroxylase n=1 Tax=Hyphodiscus hymeniophilus TaxID=353542 RepID=A0A9P6VM93_9HELO|nr:polyketide hydroxylase [Hyphodiscus hymeniophilus]